MSAKPFLDTNVLIYAFSSGDPRTERAEAILAAGGIVSVQVLNEFVNVLRCKLRWGWDEITAALAVLSTLLAPPLPLSVAVHDAAFALARDRGFAFYDALIVAAAQAAGCRILLSEGMQDGQTIDGRLTIRNPFLPEGQRT
jgi:predicted nucleic acid-binding protein